MEIRNSALRMRVFAAVLAVGVGVLAYANHGHSSASGTPNAPSSEERARLGEEAAGLRPAVSSPGNPSVPGPKMVPGESSDALVTRAMKLKQTTARLNYLAHCAKAECTGFDDSEPYSYGLDISRQTAREIEDYTALIKNNSNAVPPQAETLARYFLATGNDDVKEAALKLIELAPASAENMRASMLAMQTSASSPLMKVFLHTAMAASCAERDYASMCVSFVRERMQRGGENVQKTLARYSLEITNEYTAPLFVQLEKKLNQEDPFSLKTRYIRANNAEARRLASGG